MAYLRGSGDRVDAASCPQVNNAATLVRLQQRKVYVGRLTDGHAYGHYERDPSMATLVIFDGEEFACLATLPS